MAHIASAKIVKRNLPAAQGKIRSAMNRNCIVYSQIEGWTKKGAPPFFRYNAVYEGHEAYRFPNGWATPIRGARPTAQTASSRDWRSIGREATTDKKPLRQAVLTKPARLL